jgi:hypothetical protein
MSATVMEHKQIVRGNYVLTPCKNAYNNKTSYWMSAKDCTISVYCFTPSNRKDLENQISNESWNQYIELFENILNARRER